jgi:hypothetical protein
MYRNCLNLIGSFEILLIFHNIENNAIVVDSFVNAPSRSNDMFSS